jgi:ribosomal protein S18 acetylase RimI-like enzyme
MTGNHKFIGFAEQQLWFESLDHESFKVFLFWVNDKPAGYGIVRHDSPRVVLTGALLEEFRGRGNGRKLFTLLVNYALKYWWWPSLDVLATNQPALNLYKSLGFIEVDRNGEVISMTLKP